MASIGSAKRERLALLLAAGLSLRKAASIAQVGLRTACRWHREDAEFLKRIAQLREEMSVRAKARLTATMTRAARRLRQLIDSNNEAVALKAAVAVLTVQAKLDSFEAFDSRLRRVEIGRDAAPIAVEPMTQDEHVARLRELAEYIERERVRLVEPAGGAARPAGVNGQGNHHSNGDANVDRRKS
jgi:hypothetical protein